jgi:hypothetical protein
MFMVQRRQQRAKEESYRVYVTDMLRNIPQQRYLTQRWADLIRPHEDFDPDAIIEHVIAQLEGGAE